MKKRVLTRNGLDDKCPVIQGSDCFFEATQGFGNVNVELHDKVCKGKSLLETVFFRFQSIRNSRQSFLTMMLFRQTICLSSK